MPDAAPRIAPSWRLILSPPASGARAMALDEALLESCATRPERFRPVLRFYAFSPACLSLGRFQRIADIDLDTCARLGVDVIRRPSGGRAVLHDRCLTYALVAPVEAPPFVGGVRSSAHRIGDALVAGLRQLGAGVSLAAARPGRRHSADCFTVPGEGEVIGDGRKLSGSAQVRRGGAALQHGTVRLRSDAGSAIPFLRESDSERHENAVRPVALDALAGRPVMFTEAAQAIARGFMETFGVAFTGVAPSPEEMRWAAVLEADRSRYDPRRSIRSVQSFTPAASA